jgi:hypothetical protein
MVAEARVAVPDAPRMLFTLIFFVVPDAAIVVSETSTTGNISLTGSAAVKAVRAVIFESAIGQLD